MAQIDKLCALHAANASKAKLEQMETAVGVTFLPTGLLHDMELRDYVLPVTHTCFDSMHCVFSNGTHSKRCTCS